MTLLLRTLPLLAALTASPALAAPAAQAQAPAQPPAPTATQAPASSGAPAAKTPAVPPGCPGGYGYMMNPQAHGAMMGGYGQGRGMMYGYNQGRGPNAGKGPYGPGMMGGAGCPYAQPPAAAQPKPAPKPAQ